MCFCTGSDADVGVEAFVVAPMEFSFWGAFILCVIEEEEREEEQEEESLHDWVSFKFCCRGGARGEWVVKSLQIY